MKKWVVIAVLVAIAAPVLGARQTVVRTDLFGAGWTKQNNMNTELYQKTDPTEAGFTGMDGAVITSGSVPSAKSLSPDKTSGVPSVNFLYEANGTDTNGFGFLGPANSTKNILYRISDESPAAGNIFKVDSIAADQTITVGSGSIVADVVTLILADESGAGGYVSTPPTYSDDPGTDGQYSWDESFFYAHKNGSWDKFAVTWAGMNPAPTVPTLTSLTIPPSGDTATAVFSEAMAIGAGGSGGWTLNDPTVAMTRTGGTGTVEDPVIFSLARTVLSTDTENPYASYTQPTDGFESADDGVDLASITNASVTNNSTQTGSLLIAALNCYQNNGEALDTGGVNVTAANIAHGTGHDSVANASVVIDSASDNYYFPANQTNGLLDPSKGTIEFWYKHNGDVSNEHMFAQDSAISAFRISRNLLANQFYLTITNETVALNVSSTLWNGSWHKVRLTWDDAANVRALYMDDTQQSRSTATWTSGAITTGNMWIGNRSGFYATNAEFQDFKIYSEAIAP